MALWDKDWHARRLSAGQLHQVKVTAQWSRGGGDDMQQYLRDQVDWPQAFPAEEYAARRRRVRDALTAADIDAIVVTLPADPTCLTGYDMIWRHLRSPVEV